MRIFSLLVIVLSFACLIDGAYKARNIRTTGPTDFPYDGADGTYVWVTSFQGLGTGGLVYGTAQLDAKCAATGPSNSRAIVCSSGDYPSSKGEGRRTAFTYLNYGINQTVPTNAGEEDVTVLQPFKPVYAFNYNSNPTKWVQIAENPLKFITEGISRQGEAANFDGFFDQHSRRDINPENLDDAYYPLGDAITGCFSAKDGVEKAGLPQSSEFTCHDWTLSGTDDLGTAKAAVGSIGGEEGVYTGTLVNNWLNNDQVVNCQADVRNFIFCSWYPTNTDGIKNGDEDEIDCGGTTVPDLQLVGVAGQDNEYDELETDAYDASSISATPSCGCSCGEFFSQKYAPCVPCPQDTFCHSEEGCLGSCHSCALDANGTSPVGTTLQPFSTDVYDIGQCSCRCAAGYQLLHGYNSTLGPWDGSECELTVYGDPQITGLQGQDFQVHGIPDEFFNMISHPELQVNARFVYLEEAQCDNLTTCFTHPGTYIDQIGIMMGADNIKILAGSMEEGLRVFVQGKEISVGSKKQLSTARLVFSTSRKVSVRTPLFAFTFVNSDKFMNQEIALLDEHLAMMGSKKVVLRVGQERPHPEVPLHGLVGQTWQNIVYPEGRFIEGAVADYRLGESELFGTDFPFNKYQQA